MYHSLLPLPFSQSVGFQPLLIIALEMTVNLSGVVFIAAALPSHYTVIIVVGAGL